MGKATKHKQVLAFNLEGQFLGYMIEDGYKLKRLRLGTATGEQWIKLSKEARVSLGRVLTPGEWIQVQGEKKIDRESGEEKFKAFLIQPAPDRSDGATTVTLPKRPAEARPTKATILVCQKSDCARRGSRGLCQALEQALVDRNLTEQVAIKPTGCMKHCKAGPNLVFMPDKSRYSQIQPEDVPALVDKHFPQPEPEALHQDLGKPLPTI